MSVYDDFIVQAGMDLKKFRGAWAFGIGNPWLSSRVEDQEILKEVGWLKMADMLANLVRRGIKTATTSDYESYLSDNHPLPTVDGSFDLILNSQGNPACLIQTTRVTVLPFDQVGASYAWKEGEVIPQSSLGKRFEEVEEAIQNQALQGWRESHEKYFKKFATFSPTMSVVCEEFQVIYQF